MDSSQVQSDVQALLKHQLHLSLGFFLIVLIAFAGFVYFVERENARFDKELTQAQTVEQQFLKDEQSWKEQDEKNAALILQLSKQQQTVVKVIHDRDATTEKKVSEVTSPDRSMADTAQDIKQTFNFSPQLSQAGDMFEFNKEQTQTFVGTKLNEQRLQLDFESANQLYDLEHKKYMEVSQDEQNLRTLLTECKTSEAAYKAVAKPSKLHRILGVVKHVGEGALIGVVAYEVGHVF